MSRSSSTSLIGNAERRIAVVGAGPAGLYAADALTFDADNGVHVDLIERLPTPFGLLRHGVAPDHLKMKSLEKVMQRIIERTAVRFLGNVLVGTDVTRAELLEQYDAVVYATGAPLDRRLDIAGEDLPGSVGASDIVGWYNAHPESAPNVIPLTARRVAILGVGNVALDVARMLLISRQKLALTDVADRALRHLRVHKPDDVYIIGRRSAAQAKFTPKELRELGDLEDVDIRVDPDDLMLCESDARAVADQPQVALNLQILRAWADAPRRQSAHRLHFRFMLQPQHIEGTTRVQSLRLKRTNANEFSNVSGTHQDVQLDVDAVVRAIGFTGPTFAGLPVDLARGIIRNANGRILSQDDGGEREFVTGWARRGSTGVIGSNRGDATEIAELILSTIKPRPRAVPHGDLADLLSARDVPVVTTEGWSLIDLHERELGKTEGRPRIKLESIQEMLDVSDRGAANQAL